MFSVEGRPPRVESMSFESKKSGWSSRRFPRHRSHTTGRCHSLKCPAWRWSPRRISPFASSHDRWRLTVLTLHLHHAASFLCVGCALRPSAGVLQTCAQHGHARHGNVEHHRQVEVVAAVRRAGRQQARSGTTGREAAMTPGTLKRFMRSHGSPHPRNRPTPHANGPRACRGAWPRGTGRTSADRTRRKRKRRRSRV